MKHKAFTLIIFFFTLIQCIYSQATEIDLDQKLTLNKEIIYGKLDNNFTYYIKKNVKPKKKATIHLILKAGSLMEDDDQLGLAHLIEHMVFNGTKSYTKNEIDDYLNSIGLQIGSDYNATTGFEKTTYKMEIPTDDISKLEKGLHILSEMVGYATLDDSSFEKERKIVEEEWRSDLGKSKRLYEGYKEYFYKDSKFKDRQPIGDIEIIKNFSYDTARRFYDDWYRPDLMGIIVVGDFDPSYVKKIVEKYFSELENKNNRPMPNTLLPKYNDTIFLNQSDEEQTNILFTIRNKNKKLVLDTVRNIREKLIYDLIITIVNARFDALHDKGKMDYDFALLYKSYITSKTDTLSIYAYLKENKIKGITPVRDNTRRSRVDLILNKVGVPQVLELNTIPGLTPTSLLPKAAKQNGLEFEDLVLKMLTIQMMLLRLLVLIMIIKEDGLEVPQIPVECIQQVLGIRIM